MKLNFKKIAALAALILSFPLSAHTEGLKVYKDEYIFTRQATGEFSSEAANEKLEKKFVIIERVTGNIKLARPRAQGFAVQTLGERKAVAYDPAKDKCLTQPLDGYSCEPNYYVSIQVEPADKLYRQGKLWGLNGKHGINAPKAWSKTAGESQVVVAVIDTGTNFSHPDLAPNVWQNKREVPGNNKDDDGNGYVDDSHGFNAVSGSGLPTDDNGHGSHVAGTICAYGEGGGDLVGVSWNCKILTIKFLTANGGGSLFGAIKGIDYMVRIKEQFNIENMISNNSWGGGGYSQALKESIERARDAGIVFVAAAGNDGEDIDRSPHYPSSYRVANILRIGAIGPNGLAAKFSNYGEKSVDLSAPGVNIYSASHRGSGYIALSGTSMATPHASGVLALLLSSEPTLSVRQAIERLLGTGRRLESLEGKNRTGKTLDAYRALFNLSIPNPPPPVVTPECRIRRFKKCKQSCCQDLKGQRRERKVCVGKCRVSHDCPLTWRNLWKEWMTFGEVQY